MFYTDWDEFWGSETATHKFSAEWSKFLMEALETAFWYMWQTEGIASNFLNEDIIILLYLSFFLWVMHRLGEWGVRGWYLAGLPYRINNFIFYAINHPGNPIRPILGRVRGGGWFGLFRLQGPHHKELSLKYVFLNSLIHGVLRDILQCTYRWLTYYIMNTKFSFQKYFKIKSPPLPPPTQKREKSYITLNP